MNLSRTLPMAAFGLLALGACSSGDLEGHARITPAATAAPADTGTAGTGDASVDEMIVDAVWAGDSGKAALCPSFNDIKVSMPNLSGDEIFDMGVRLSHLDDTMAPGQLDHLRELVVNDC